MVNSGRVVVKRDEDSVAVERRVWSQISHLNKLFHFLNFGFISKIKFITAPTLDALLNDNSYKAINQP